jgi:hypothetical protein
LRTAYSFLEAELQANGVQTVNEEAPIKSIPANISEYDPLPVDLVIPRKMQERLAGSSDEFTDMYYHNNIPQITLSSVLVYWTWRIDRIFFLPSTTNREVKLFYQKSFPALNTADAMLFGKAEQYLAAKVAALAHMFLAQNTTLAKVANEIAEKELAEIVNMQVKLMQTVPVRRKGYIPQTGR